MVLVRDTMKNFAPGGPANDGVIDIVDAGVVVANYDTFT